MVINFLLFKGKRVYYRVTILFVRKALLAVCPSTRLSHYIKKKVWYLSCIRKGALRKNFATLGKRLRGNWYSILLFLLFQVIVKVHLIKMHSFNAFVCFEGSTTLYNPHYFFVLKDIPSSYMTFLSFKGYTLLYDLLCVLGPIHLYALIVFHCLKDLPCYMIPFA